MTQEQVMGIFQQAIILAFKLAGPLLAISIIIGLVIAIFQAATQIHEQTLTFVPKVVAIALLLLLLGPWMITMLSDFMRNLFGMIPTL
ncbi:MULTISPECIES: flagellar biosynthesis protein FliQ [Anaerotruncus]|jgi:flagellar biosynthetic protein FliQ|uniref:Flagellar biosynthetic protein FliQ n=1 Tax=Anaerotruncus colihominis TaxID=169435 RepID=A0A845SXX1_9FIRM|nr:MULTISPECIES: flagellar biosynthesis protein FliQ [Anaerotruncus]MCI8492891.1 flagellar biosynthesis protein FliQ [Anaerotruncus sp.]MCR2024331.1 flagellar biosynthesis protein FliQ [Anaerotruncus colihominis]NDO39122.1 flagellar biosynthesis protein FliQ [Anaerotruncus colihominis]